MGATRTEENIRMLMIQNIAVEYGQQNFIYGFPLLLKFLTDIQEFIRFVNTHRNWFPKPLALKIVHVIVALNKLLYFLESFVRSQKQFYSNCLRKLTNQSYKIHDNVLLETGEDKQPHMIKHMTAMDTISHIPLTFQRDWKMQEPFYSHKKYIEKFDCATSSHYYRPVTIALIIMFLFILGSCILFKCITSGFPVCALGAGLSMIIGGVCAVLFFVYEFVSKSIINYILVESQRRYYKAIVFLSELEQWIDGCNEKAMTNAYITSAFLFSTNQIISIDVEFATEIGVMEETIKQNVEYCNTFLRHFDAKLHQHSCSHMYSSTSEIV